MVDLQQNREEICVRLFQPSDSESILGLYQASMVKEYDSPFSRAMRAQLVAPLSLASYATIGLGLSIKLTFKNNHLQKYGSIISAAGAIGFLLYRLLINLGLKRVVRQQFEGDLADISKHYGLAGPSAGSKMEGIGASSRERSAFWVAECHLKGRKPTVIGCVGLDDSTDPDPEKAELRRMIVASSFRRRGVALRLLTSLIEHARLHNIKTVFFNTSSYQTEAMKMYQYYGWKPQHREDVSVLFQPIYMQHFLLHVDEWRF